jgi:hypothetical protein
MKVLSKELVTLGEKIAENAAHIDAAMHRLLTDIRRFDAEQGWYDADFRSCADWLSGRVGWDLGTARDRVRVARRLGELPKIDDALRRGALSYSKCRALVRVATPDSEDALMVCAETTTAAQLEKICRRYQAVQRTSDKNLDGNPPRRYVNRRVLDDGMVRMEVVLHPEEAERVWQTTLEAAKGVSAETLDLADGFMAVFDHAVSGGSPLRTPVEVVVTVPQTALAAGTNAEIGELPSGTPVSAETARFLSCDAGIVEIQEAADGTTLSVGRKTRSIPAALKRALVRRDGTCRYPGCTNTAFVHGHHLKHWADGGETALENIITLCSSHHKLVHDRGIRVELDADRNARFFNRHGVQIEPYRKPPWLRAPGLRTLRADNAKAGVTITEDTNRGRWDGSPVQYGWCTQALTGSTGG